MLALIVCTLPLNAQEVGSSRSAGHAAGGAAAQDRSIAPAFIIGLMGGVPVGISGAHYIGPDRNEARLTPALAGAGILIGGAVGIQLTSKAPRSRQRDLMAPDLDEYQLGFREGYESRLRSRRRNALARGGLVGVGVGAVAYSWLRRLGR